jgi:type III secretory pathway component EscT
MTVPSNVWTAALPGLAPGGAALVLAACRCGPLLLAVPMLGLWGRVTALVLGTLLVTPLLLPAVAATGLAGAALLPLCARELLVGATLALAAALPWAVAHSVGSLVDGLGSAGPLGGSPNRVAAQLYGALALALFFGLGGARLTLLALAASYELLPLPTPQHPEPVAGWRGGSAQGLVTLSGRLLWLAIRLALPLLCAQLLAELLLTLPGRFGPLPCRSRTVPALRSLVWLGVLLVGAHALFPAFRQLLAAWPSLVRQALDPR